MEHKSFAVIGLGDFGKSLVAELVALGKDLIVIDRNEERVKEISELVPAAFVADSTDEIALKELGVHKVDYAIVCFGTSKESTIITTAVLKELKVKHIIVRADDQFYVSILKKLGADEVITPQKTAGQALANRIGTDEFTDFYKIDPKFSVVSIKIKDDFKPVKIMDFKTKDKFGINLVLIQRNNKTFIPGGKDMINPSDNIFVIGKTNDIKRFSLAINK